MIEERSQDVREHLEDTDDKDTHDDPLPNLLGKRIFHDPPKQQAEYGNDDRHDDGGPEHETLAENQLIHRNQGPTTRNFYIPDARRLQIHLIHMCIPLQEAERLVERVRLRARGVRCEAKVDG